MAYPLTGSAISAALTLTAVPVPALELTPSRTWTRPFTLRSRAAALHNAGAAAVAVVHLTDPSRRWGLAAGQSVFPGESWGVF